ncbi:hypothetical protein B0H19DRAFT_1284358, partial [Mycena capillaripes]
EPLLFVNAAPRRVSDGRPRREHAERTWGSPATYSGARARLWSIMSVIGERLLSRPTGSGIIVPRDGAQGFMRTSKTEPWISAQFLQGVLTEHLGRGGCEGGRRDVAGWQRYSSDHSELACRVAAGAAQPPVFRYFELPDFLVGRASRLGQSQIGKSDFGG